MQTPRERLLNLLKGQKPDRLPWFGDLSYWHYYNWINNSFEKKYENFEGLINLHKDLGVGFYYPGYYPYTISFNNCKMTEVERNIGIDSQFYKGTAYADTIYKGFKKGVEKIKNDTNNDLIRDIITPKGTIQEIWTYAQKSLSWSPSKYFIKSPEDLEILNYYLKDSAYETDYANIQETKKIVKDQGVIVCNLNKSPLMDFIHWYAGIMTTMNIMMDNKKQLEETIGLLDKKADEAVKIAAVSEADILLIPDNLHSDLVGKNLFEQFLKPHYEKQNKQIKNFGKYSSIHMDGGLKVLLKEVSQTGFSIIEALTPKPLGDLYIEEFKDYVSSDSVMWGGIPGVLFTDSTSDAEFRDFALKIINIMTSSPRYVLGIADQIPPDGIIERISLVSELVEKYGSY